MMTINSSPGNKKPGQPPRVFISADHGLAIVYFLQSDVVPTLLHAGVEVILLTDDALKEQIQNRFNLPGLIVEGLRLEKANAYARQVHPEVQWWLQTLRRVGSSNRINTQAMDSYVDQIAVEEGWRRRMLMPLGHAAIGLLRHSTRARRSLINQQMHYIPGIYTDLFHSFQPSLVVASTPGWRMDRYLLRCAPPSEAEVRLVHRRVQRTDSAARVRSSSPRPLPKLPYEMSSPRRTDRPGRPIPVGEADREACSRSFHFSRAQTRGPLPVKRRRETKSFKYKTCKGYRGSSVSPDQATA
jgi:hypothetical protein